MERSPKNKQSKPENSRTVIEVLHDLRHPGFRGGDSEQTFSEKTQDIFRELAVAITKEGTTPGEPKLSPGFVRLYRGEPLAGDFPKDRPVVKAHALAEQYGNLGSRWFELLKSEALVYAGRDGSVYYVDVPVNLLMQYEAINLGTGLPGEFILPESIVSEKQILPKSYPETARE